MTKLTVACSRREIKRAEEGSDRGHSSHSGAGIDSKKDGGGGDENSEGVVKKFPTESKTIKYLFILRMADKALKSDICRQIFYVHGGAIVFAKLRCN